jgi:hypothetical protein
LITRGLMNKFAHRLISEIKRPKPDSQEDQ